jgi:signal transduction histidine kinase
VIENLVSNAITHSNGNIMISLIEIDSIAKLIVRNDSHSLTKEDFEHMFDRFYMADQSRAGKSNGLGLSIVKSFMEKMNGTISAHLKDGQLSIVCEWKAVENKNL